MLFEKNAVQKKRFKIAACPEGHGLKQFDFAPGRVISRQTLEEIVKCRRIAKRVPYQRRNSRRYGQPIAITGATGSGKRFLALVISSERSKEALTSDTGV